MQDGGENIAMARARFPGKSSQQNGSRKRLWLPEDQFEECSFVTRKEAALAIRTSKNFDVLFSGSSKNPEGIRRLSSCLGESVYAVSKRLRAFSAPPCEPERHASGSSGSSSAGGGAASPVAGAAGRARRRTGRTPSGEPAAVLAAQSFSVSESAPAARRGRTRGDTSRASSEAGSEASESSGGRRTRAAAGSAASGAARPATPPADEAARRTRSRSHSQSASPTHSAASGSSSGGSGGADAADSGAVRTRRGAAAAPAPVGELGPRPPEPSSRTTRSASQAAPPAAAPAPAPAPATATTPVPNPTPTTTPTPNPNPTPTPTPTPGLVVTRSSRVVRPARRFLDESPLSNSSSPAPLPPPAAESTRPPRPARALSPSSDVELDEGVIKTVGEYADSMAAAPGRGASVAPPPAAEPAPATQPAQSEIEAMLRAQWDSRLKVRGKEEEAAAVSSRHLLRQPRLQLNNRVLKRLRDGRDLTYLSEQDEAPQEETETGGAAVTGNGTSASGQSSGGHVTCGPCGSRRYVAVPDLCYKFGSWICMHCIKFVLATLKQTSLAPKCLDDKELCRIHAKDSEPESPTPDKRCEACWLKTCLDALNFSEERHNRLRSSLPRAQQASVPLFSRKRRQETGRCEYGPLPTATATPVITPTPPAAAAAPPASCPHKAWGGEAAPDPVGFEALSRPAAAKEQGEVGGSPATEPEKNASETPAAEKQDDTAEKESNDKTQENSTDASKDESKPAPTRTVTRSRTQKWPPPPPGVHSRKAVTVVPLGGGWKRREFVRKGGRLDLVVYSPDGTRFKSVVELQAYLRGMDITRKAKSFFTDGPPPPLPPPEPAADKSPAPATAPASGEGVKQIAPEHVQQDVVMRDSFVKRGPRVKVVCRSASLVLGQPRATFGGGSPPAEARADSPPAPPLSPQPPPPPPGPSPPGKENKAAARPDGWSAARRHAVTVKKLKKRRQVAGDDKASSRNVLMKLKVLHKYKHLQQSRGNKERMRKSRCGTCIGCKAKNCTNCVFCLDMIKYGGPGKLKKSCIRRVCKRPLLPGVNSLKLLSPGGAGDRADHSPERVPASGAASSPLKAADPDTPAAGAATLTTQPGRRSSPLVRLDHWSPRDPTELWERGLAVLAAQPPGVPVLCFVCASAGKEEMLYCNSCCEPYHPFCLEEVEVPRSAQHQENWVCGRCQVCCVCGAAPPAQPLHRCHQCNETYHLSCLGPHACPLPGRADQPWMLGWPFAPAGPHAEPAAAAMACSPLPPPPADGLTPLVCHCCTDLPKVEDPAADRRSPIAWRRPPSPPLLFDMEELFGTATSTAAATATATATATDPEEMEMELDYNSDVSVVEEPSFAGFSRRAVFGGPPGEQEEGETLEESDRDERDDALLAMLTKVEEGEESDGDDDRAIEHRKRKKRRKRKRLGRPPKKCRWKEISAQRRAEAAVALVEKLTPSPEKVVKLKPRARPRSPLRPPKPPLPEVYTIPLEYELLDQAAALELLFAGMNVPCMTGLELEKIGLELCPMVEYRETGDPCCIASDDTDASDMDEPLSVVDYLWETVDAELEALGYPPATVPFVLGAGRERRRRRERTPERPERDRPPRRASAGGSHWARSRLPPGMTEIEWERWRRLLPPRKGRPRKFPRDDDLLLIDQLKQTCVRCTRCRSCQKAEIHQYVGNLPLCANCFQLHQRGNYCPLCGGCYEDDDYDTKMMECESCHTWVHAHCENLSEEMYQILSFLPESVSYLCDRCLPKPPPPPADGSEATGSPERRRPLPLDVSWRRAVRHEFESGCAAVVRAVWSCLSRRPVAQERPAAPPDAAAPVPGRAAAPLPVPPSAAAAGEAAGQEDDQVVPDTAAADAEPPTAARLRQLRTQLRRGDVASVRAFHRLLQGVLAEAEQAGGGTGRARAAYQRAMADAFPWFHYDGRAVTPVKPGVAHPDHPYAAGGAAGAGATSAAAAAAQMTSPTEVRARASPSKYPRTPLKRLSAASAGNHEQFRPLIDLCNRHYQALRALEAGRLPDTRRCGLCTRGGESGPAGRLLWAGAGHWLHAGCLLHSTEVFEEVDGSLRAVRAALHRGRQTRCLVCAERGATVACGRRGCARSAHLPCAAEAGWYFGALPSCPEHCPEGGEEGSGQPDPVRRRVFIEEGDWLRRRPTEAPLDSATAVLGSLTVHSFGDRVVPSSQSLLPVGMTCSRVYWSTINPRRRTVYTVRTVSTGPPPPSDLHCVVDHSLSQTQVDRSLQQLDEWRRAVAARSSRPQELLAAGAPGSRAAARIVFESAAESRSVAAATPAGPSGGAGASEDHEQQVRSCLDSLLGNVCRSVVEEEETLLAEANLNIPILENVDNDFLNLMLKELCEGDGATYLGGEGGGGSAAAAAGPPPSPPPPPPPPPQPDHCHGHGAPTTDEMNSQHMTAVSEPMSVNCDSAAPEVMVGGCEPRGDALSVDCEPGRDALTVGCDQTTDAMVRQGLTESEQVAEIAESLEQLSHGSAEVSSSQLQMSPQQPDEPPPPPPPPPPSVAYDWQTGRARHRSERLPGYHHHHLDPTTTLLSEYPAVFESGAHGGPHPSAFRPAARRGRSLSAEQASYEELMTFKPVATVMPEPRDQLWPAELRTYSAQVHCRRRSGPGAPAAPLLCPPGLYQSWCPSLSGWAPHETWHGHKADGWQQLAPGHQRTDAGAALPRQLSQLDGADDSDDEAAPQVPPAPSKCPKCRRMYRTRESMLKHQHQCDFEVDSSGSSEAEDEAAEGARAEPRRAFVEPGEAPPQLPAATGEAEVSSTTAPLPSETPKLEIKQEVAEEAAPSTTPARASPARPRRRSPKKKASPSFAAPTAAAAAAAPAAPPPPASVGMPLPQLLMIGNQLVNPGQMLLPQVQQPGVVIVQGNVSYTVVPQQEPLLYGQPAPFLVNYPQLALPPGANLQHLGSFELGPAAGQLPQPVVYSMSGLAGGLVAPMPPAASVSAPGVAAPVGVQQHLQTPPAAGVFEMRPPAPPPPVAVTPAPAPVPAAAPEPMEVSLPPPPPPPPPAPAVQIPAAPPAPPPAAPAPVPAAPAPIPPPAARSSPVQSSQVDSSRPQSADSPLPPSSPAQTEAGSPPPAAAAPSRQVQVVKPSTVVAPAASSDARKVAKVKPRPTYSYRDAMKTNPMLQQEKGKLMRRLVPLEVDSTSAVGRAATPAVCPPPPPASAAGAAPAAAAAAGPPSPAPSVSSSGAGAEPEDGLKLSYRIKLRRDRADDGFQVREIVRNPAGEPVSPGATLKSVKITARVGSLGSDVLVVPRRQTTETEVEVRGDRAADRTGDRGAAEEDPDKENRSGRRQEADSADPAVVYEVTSADGFKFRSPDIAEVWRRVFEAVQDARTGMKMKPLAYNARSVSGRQMLGLTHDAVQFLLEQMPGAEDCSKHSFRFHKPEFGPLKENPFGCARAEGFSHRKPIDMFSWLASKHRQLPEPSSATQPPPANKLSRRGSSLELPMAMRYRQLCDSTRDMVGVYRSPISGRGLFCKRTVEAGQMVIEYAGQVIRSSLTDIRERYYSSRGIGCYMFRIDDDFVVDATMKGNAARFINHSCNPNCYSRVVDILGKKHIIIFALRKILRGEELTYDYKFPIEEDKIPCTCGARRCRKYLN